MYDALNQYALILLECFKYDVTFYQQLWVWAIGCIPAAAYAIFMIIKWTVLLAPAWLVPSIIVASFKPRSGK